MKKLRLAAFGLAVSLLCGGAQAKEWSVHKVKLAGTSPNGTIYLRLYKTVDNETRHYLYNLLPTIKNTGLAIGLAAVSSNRKIQILSNQDTVAPGETPLITEIYLTDEIAN